MRSPVRASILPDLSPALEHGVGDLHPPMTVCGHRVEFARTWREGFFEVPYCPNVCFASRLMGPERKDDLCVSSVSIVCGRPGHLQAWARAKLTVFVPNRTSRTPGLLF